MNLDKLFLITEKLQKQTIGDPVGITKNESFVFEYPEQSLKVVAVLKAIRAVQGLKSMHLLCENGLFIDVGATFRCVSDCTSEVYFLLEQYPRTSRDVDQFVKAFFETTIDGYLDAKTDYVRTRKIHDATVRILSEHEPDELTRSRILRIYKTFCGYTHANYAHIMEIYGGNRPNLSFNLAGVPSVQQRTWHMQIVEAAYFSVLYAIGFAAQKFNLTDLEREILKIL